jgi:hypothetical protein
MSKYWHTIYVVSFFVVGIGATLLLAVNGYQFYTTPIQNRFFSSQYDLLKPSGFLGHGLGILGSLMMILGVAIYMIRKRMRRLFSWGYLKHWLELHIFLCTLGPVFVLYHTAFKFGGIVAVSFWSMVAVVLSGVIGRFIYVQIPRTIQGQELNMNELSEISSGLTLKLRKDFFINEALLLEFEQVALPSKYKRITFANSVAFIIKDYFSQKLIMHRLKKSMKFSGVSKIRIQEMKRTVKQKLILSRRIGLLRTMQKFFRYWHIVHLPFAITMFIIMFIHIGVTVAFGYRWIF